MESPEGTHARRAATAKSRRSGARGKALWTPVGEPRPRVRMQGAQPALVPLFSFSAPAVSGFWGQIPGDRCLLTGLSPLAGVLRWPYLDMLPE
jgi:hypothetical protein